jgi:Metallo-beta-lactamase superfamily
MATPTPLEASKLRSGDVLASTAANELVYFVCNVGDGDAQVLMLPVDPVDNVRRAIVVDAGRTKKVPGLLRELVRRGYLAGDQAGGEPADESIPLVVATHPHRDHIAGMAELLRQFGNAIVEFWEPGYYQAGPDYHEMMAEVEGLPALRYAQPTSGLRRWIGDVLVTVLSPSIRLRNRFDTYGIEVNNSSISLRVEFPAARVVQRDDERQLVKPTRTNALILGSDAQTTSWSHVDDDFPHLLPLSDAANKAIRGANGADFLRADVLKISHHGSKHGVNLELVERIKPRRTLFSSVGGGGSYNFPHDVAQGLIREALKPASGTGEPTQSDVELGMFYTSDTATPGGDPLGSIAIVVGRRKRDVWRFGDTPSQPVNLDAAREWTGDLP